MSKSYKLKDGNYIDSTSIVHNKEKLSNILGTAKTIWSGTAYESNTSINVNLKSGHTYIFKFMGISGVYMIEFIFTFDRSMAQFAYNDGKDYFRYRFNVSTSEVKITNESINNKANTALKEIKELY